MASVLTQSFAAPAGATTVQRLAPNALPRSASFQRSAEVPSTPSRPRKWLKKEQATENMSTGVELGMAGAFAATAILALMTGAQRRQSRRASTVLAFDKASSIPRHAERRPSSPSSDKDLEPLPTWEAMRVDFQSTKFGVALSRFDELCAAGRVSHTNAKVRYFGKGRGKPRVTLYRDQAVWCPNCQKVWLLLEAKRVDYAVIKVPMRSYGDKPDEFSKKVPRGLLPAIEIDGELMTESLEIMFKIETVFSDPARPMFPSVGRVRDGAVRLLELERALVGSWRAYLFRPGVLPLRGGNSTDFECALGQVDLELSRNSTSPWFLHYDHPTIVDIQYVPLVERMVASCLYYKGYNIRENFPFINRWLQEFEKLPYYIATKGDYYTHCMAIPPEYGLPFPNVSEEATLARRILSPQNAKLPIATDIDKIEPATIGQQKVSVKEHCVKAAWALMRNNVAVTRFCCRALGNDVGDWASRDSTKAELADPYARASQEFLDPVSAVLRAVTIVLLENPENTTLLARRILQAVSETEINKDDLPKVALCLDYLRDRVGVPRDLDLPAARLLRAHLGSASAVLRDRA